MKAVFVVILFASYIMTQSAVNAVPTSLLELNEEVDNPIELKNNEIKMIRTRSVPCPYVLCRLSICPPGTVCD
jgi:hypothetical protein